MEDGYERSEDMRKLDYQRRAALILDKQSPFTNSVRQRGTFDPFRKTYGSEMNFPNKLVPTKDPELFGAFRIGNLPKKGYNKCLGGNFPYIENPIEDMVTYQKDVKQPVWRNTQVSTTTAFKPQYSTYINTKGQLRDK